MNRDNLALFIFAFVFYFIDDPATTLIALKRDNYLCGAVLGLVAGMGMTVTWMNAMAIMEYPV